MTYHLAHMEAAANTVIGVVVSQIVLFAFGVPMRDAFELTAVIIMLSYVRSFVLRLMFRRLERRESGNNGTWNSAEDGHGGHIPHGSL